MPRDKQVTVFPTYGFRTERDWTVPVRVWVSKARRVGVVSDDHIRALLLEDAHGSLPTEDEVVRCRQCIADFIADSDSFERVVLFDEAGRELLELPRTDSNGLTRGELHLPPERSGRMTIIARVTGTLGGTFEGRGVAILLEPEGRSIVSDIDDTIKVTEVPAGKAIVLRNTFLRAYVAAEGMRDRYRGLGGEVSFHYVSGSPWQLFRLLHTFLVDEAAFPPGTFHMKDLRTSPLELTTFLTDIRGLVTGKEATKEQKIEQISALMNNLPRRTFTLIGDSGELDPEVFTELRRTHGAQVQKIVIRDVVDARHTAPERLEGVDEIIDAPVIRRGVSQFM